MCAESHISAATPARRRRAGLSLRRQAEAIVKTSTSHDRDRSSAFLVANFSGAGTSSSPQASHRMDGACCASLCSHQDISRRLLLRDAVAWRGNARKTVRHPLDRCVGAVTPHGQVPNARQEHHSHFAASATQVGHVLLRHSWPDQLIGCALRKKDGDAGGQGAGCIPHRQRSPWLDCRQVLY